MGDREARQAAVVITLVCQCWVVGVVDLLLEVGGVMALGTAVLVFGFLALTLLGAIALVLANANAGQNGR